MMTGTGRHSVAKMLLLFPLLLVMSGCGRSPESVVERFYRAVAKGEITEAQGYLSSQVAGMMGSQKLSAGLASESQRVQQCGGIKEIEVQLQGEGEIRSGTVSVSYKGQCAAKRESVKLVKEAGNWKLVPSK